MCCVAKPTGDSFPDLVSITAQEQTALSSGHLPDDQKKLVHLLCPQRLINTEQGQGNAILNTSQTHANKGCFPLIKHLLLTHLTRGPSFLYLPRSRHMHRSLFGNIQFCGSMGDINTTDQKPFLWGAQFGEVGSPLASLPR